MTKLPTITDVAEYLQMPELFVEHEIRMEYLEAIHIGYDWRIAPSALVEYIEARRTVTPLVSKSSANAAHGRSGLRLKAETLSILE